VSGREGTSVAVAVKTSVTEAILESVRGVTEVGSSAPVTPNPFANDSVSPQTIRTAPLAVPHCGGQAVDPLERDTSILEPGPRIIFTVCDGPPYERRARGARGGRSCARPANAWMRTDR
jgi:hypothetical protein